MNSSAPPKCINTSVPCCQALATFYILHLFIFFFFIVNNFFVVVGPASAPSSCINTSLPAPGSFSLKPFQAPPVGKNNQLCWLVDSRRCQVKICVLKLSYTAEQWQYLHLYFQTIIHRRAKHLKPNLPVAVFANTPVPL